MRCRPVCLFVLLQILLSSTLLRAETITQPVFSKQNQVKDEEIEVEFSQKSLDAEVYQEQVSAAESEVLKDETELVFSDLDTGENEDSAKLELQQSTRRSLHTKYYHNQLPEGLEPAMQNFPNEYSIPGLVLYWSSFKFLTEDSQRLEASALE